MQRFTRLSQKALWLSLFGTLVLTALVASFAPMERTLGERARLVYFHGAWVWVGKAAFATAAVAGLVGLLPGLRGAQKGWQRASVALGWTGMAFWLTYLPLSLLVQQMNWGGIFWDEPRWRIPLMFGVVGLLLQVGLALMENLRLASAANLVFGVALWWFLGTIQNVLHPDSPIFSSNATLIQLFFVALMAGSLLFGLILARLFILRVPERWK
jgi:hypothetical protein